VDTISPASKMSFVRLAKGARNGDIWVQDFIDPAHMEEREMSIHISRFTSITPAHLFVRKNHFRILTVGLRHALYSENTDEYRWLLKKIHSSLYWSLPGGFLPAVCSTENSLPGPFLGK
jgi:hypothetical protein